MRPSREIILVVITRHTGKSWKIFLHFFVRCEDNRYRQHHGDDESHFALDTVQASSAEVKLVPVDLRVLSTQLEVCFGVSDSVQE